MSTTTIETRVTLLEDTVHNIELQINNLATKIMLNGISLIHQKTEKDLQKEIDELSSQLAAVQALLKSMKL